MKCGTALPDELLTRSWIVKGVDRNLQFVHKCRYLHCDIRKENILLFEDGDGHQTPQLIDFGLSCKMDGDDPRVQCHNNYLIFPASHQARSAGLRVQSLLKKNVHSQWIDWSVGDDYQMLLNLLFYDDSERASSQVVEATKVNHSESDVETSHPTIFSRISKKMKSFSDEKKELSLKPSG